MDDQDWIRLLKADDPGAREKLWQHLYQWGWNLARRYRQEVDVGCDAAVEAFIRITTKGIYQYQFRGPFLGYCRRILVNEFWRKLPPPPDLPLPDEVPGPDDPSPQADPAEVWNLLQSCLDELEPRERKAIELKYFEGLSAREIADQLGITSANNVNQILHRARKKLLDCLKRRGYKDREDIL